MFLVPTYVAASRIDGRGVFTPVAIPAHTVVWDMDPEIDWLITPEELAQFPEPYRSRFVHYCYLNVDGFHVYCGDNGKYMNHQNEPNCYESGTQTITARDIEAGEELTCDYRAFVHNPQDHPVA